VFTTCNPCSSAVGCDFIRSAAVMAISLKPFGPASGDGNHSTEGFAGPYNNRQSLQPALADALPGEYASTFLLNHDAPLDLSRTDHT